MVKKTGRWGLTIFHYSSTPMLHYSKALRTTDNVRQPTSNTNPMIPNTTDPLVKVENLTVRFNAGRTGFWGQRFLMVHAVENVSFHIRPGETLGLVGESGSGKSTTGRAILRRVPLTGGRIVFRGDDITQVSDEDLRPLRRHMQLVFQDPYASLNPRMRIVDIVAEPLVVHGLVKSSREAAKRSASCWIGWDFPRMQAAAILMPSAAASASGSALPGLWLSARSSSWPTSLYRPWTSRSAPRS